MYLKQIKSFMHGCFTTGRERVREEGGWHNKDSAM